MEQEKSGFLQPLRRAVWKYFPDTAEKINYFLYDMQRRNYFRKGRLEVHLADHCNLNCRCCNHYSPLAEESFLSLPELRRMYEKLKPVYHRFFKRILLLGGEPLLHPDMEEILHVTAACFPDSEIEIVTNGIKLGTMGEGFWEGCRKYKVLISVTSYPGIMEGGGLENLLREKGTAYRFWGFRETFVHRVLDPDGKQNARKSWKKCIWGGHCLQLRDGKIFPCAQSAYIGYINDAFGTGFGYQKGDYIPLEELGSRFRFWRFVSTPKPFCRYCNVEESREEKWGISQRKREEWLPEQTKNQ